jgi:hypothetical protein
MNVADVECWSVYFIPNCKHTNIPKDKYVIAACIETDAMAFFINSEPTEWMKSRSFYSKCVVKISKNEHNFLRRDSYVMCDVIKPYTGSEISHFMGIVTNSVKSEMLNAIHLCPLLERKYKQLILSNEGYPGYSK